MIKPADQLFFKFENRPDFSREDFMPSKCNEEALRAVESWPNWSFFALALYGPSGCGKTHLAHIFASKVQQSLQKPVRVSILQTAQIHLKKIDRIYAENPCLVIDNLTQDVDNEALFHLFNMYQNSGGYLLITSEEALARMRFKLPDLQSRLKLIPSIAIGEPDDEMLSALIVKLFFDRQMTISQEVLNYILQNMQRSFAYARKLVAETDAISLARQRAVSIPIIKEAMSIINSNIQPDFFK